MEDTNDWDSECAPPSGVTRLSAAKWSPTNLCCYDNKSKHSQHCLHEIKHKESLLHMTVHCLASKPV